VACLPTVVALCAALQGSPYVVDGDTLRFGSQAVRLYGVDAEERSEPNGPAATAGLRRIVAGTAYIRCVPTGDTTHRRVVAQCFTAEGQDVAAMLITQGLALDCPRYSRGAYSQYEPKGVRERLAPKPYCTPRR